MIRFLAFYDEIMQIDRKNTFNNDLLIDLKLPPFFNRKSFNNKNHLWCKFVLDYQAK